MTSAPFRADHVGSLLRKPDLIAAMDKTPLDASLKDLQDRYIKEAIALQESVGLYAVTDGELRRKSFHVDFLEKVEGAKRQGLISDNNAMGRAPPGFAVTAKLKHARPIEVENFKFVKANTKRLAKQTMPSPTMLLRGGRSTVSKEAYPDLEAFYADIANVYREELKQLGDAGCSYVQLDDTNYAYLCDPKMLERIAATGDDPAALPKRYAKVINASIAGRPDGMVIGIHLCRGNSRSAWHAEGAYEPIAEVLLNDVAVDGYFLEYDDQRSGGFEPLRFYPKGSKKKIVLGLVSSKVPAMETKDDLKRRIDEAAKYVPLENLCLSPQCGFASTYLGNQITEDVQKRKLELVVQTATDVWGSAQ